MEAPKKLYLNQDDGLIWHCRSYKDDIEYIRKDAFIEKACEFLKSYRQDTPDGTGYIAGIINEMIRLLKTLKITLKNNKVWKRNLTSVA